MTERERQSLKTRLIEADLWNADEPGDPTAEWAAMGRLTERMERRLPPDAYLLFNSASGQKMHFEVGIILGSSEVVLASGEDLYTATCRAALRLLRFLAERAGGEVANAKHPRLTNGHENIDARLAELFAIKDAIAERLERIEATLTQCKMTAARVQETLAKEKSYQAFVRAGGISGDFERLWPDTFEAGLLSEADDS